MRWNERRRYRWRRRLPRRGERRTLVVFVLLLLLIIIIIIIIRFQILLDRGGDPPVEIGPSSIAPPVAVPRGQISAMRGGGLHLVPGHR